MALLIQLSLEGGLDFVDFFLAADGFLDPSDDYILLEIRKWDEVFGALKADGTVSTRVVGAVVSVDGVVYTPVTGSKIF